MSTSAARGSSRILKSDEVKNFKASLEGRGFAVPVARRCHLFITGLLS